MEGIEGYTIQDDGTIGLVENDDAFIQDGEVMTPQAQKDAETIRDDDDSG